jgi:hypothetical protein
MNSLRPVHIPHPSPQTPLNMNLWLLSTLYLWVQ